MFRISLFTKLYMKHLLNMGPPKHAAKAILWYPFLANAVFVKKSPTLLPQARILIPSRAGLSSRTLPIV